MTFDLSSQDQQHFDFKSCSINNNELISLMAITSDRAHLVEEEEKEEKKIAEPVNCALFSSPTACFNDWLQIAMFR